MAGVSKLKPIDRTESQDAALRTPVSVCIGTHDNELNSDLDHFFGDERGSSIVPKGESRSPRCV